MANRKLIRPEVEASAEGRAVRRKTAPPEQTNAEEYYYLKQMSQKTSMVVVLNNDEELIGEIEWYDKNSIKLNRHREPSLVILKHNIRYLFKEDERKRGQRRARSVRAKASSKLRPKQDSDGDDE